MSTADRLLSYQATAAILDAHQIPLAPARVVSTPSEAADAAIDLGLPVALKALSSDLTHKSDAGLVYLDLQTPGAVESAGRTLADKTSGVQLEGLLVQTMVAGGVEVIAGLSRDPQFSLVIMLGAGGVLVELLDDIVLRLPPLTSQQAGQMIREIRVWHLLSGYRGQPAADIPALAQLIVNLSDMAIRQADRLVSLDLNPVIVLPQGGGVQVVDARMLVRE
ncbi:MAG: acetate--CoA ligase family protein [Chloroflexota bacterium]|nr:acetate--CoA ligase family protein [Chloroflexota bacterium]